MSPRRNDRRLRDIESAITAIDRHLTRGTISDELVFDACRARLFEIGEAVKDIEPALLARSPDTPWREIARMRDHLPHRYFDTQHEIVADLIETDLPALKMTVKSLRSSLADRESGQARLDEDT